MPVQSMIRGGVLAVVACIGCSDSPTTPTAVRVGPFVLNLRSVNPCDSNSPAFANLYTFSGILQVTNEHLRFVADQTVPQGQPLTLDATRAGDRLSGTLLGTGVDADGYIVSAAVSKDSASGAALVGQVNAATVITGTLDGYIRVVHRVFSVAEGCSGTQSLTLRSP
jgi:hypothetical protein